MSPWGFNANSTAAKNVVAAGYPPDIVNAAGSLWANYWASFWEVTQCQWQKRLDPSYDTYGSGTGTYNYFGRIPFSDVAENMAHSRQPGRSRRRSSRSPGRWIRCCQSTIMRARMRARSARRLTPPRA